MSDCSNPPRIFKPLGDYKDFDGWHNILAKLSVSPDEASPSFHPLRFPNPSFPIPSPFISSVQQDLA